MFILVLSQLASAASCSPSGVAVCAVAGSTWKCNLDPTATGTLDASATFSASYSISTASGTTADGASFTCITSTTLTAVNIYGSDQADTITISAYQPRAEAWTVTTVLGDDVVEFAASVGSAYVDLGGGDDTFEGNSDAEPKEVDGGAGDDDIHGATLAYGGAGSDYLLAPTHGDSVMYGEGGADTIGSWSQGQVYMDGGSGDDDLHVAYAFRGASVWGGGGADSLLVDSTAPVGVYLYGEAGDDDLCDRSSAAMIQSGGAGTDTCSTAGSGCETVVSPC